MVVRPNFATRLPEFTSLPHTAGAHSWRKLMPTYQYRCNDCGDDLEVVQRFTDDPLTVCPSCTGNLRKVFNAVGVVFKGSGFYKTDSRPTSGATADKGSTAADSSAKKPTSDGGSASGSTKSETISSSSSSSSSSSTGS